MDLITIATFVSLEVASGFLKAPGQDIYQKVKKLLTPQELISLDLLEKYPQSKELQGEVATAVQRHLETNPDITKELEAFLAKLPQNRVTQTGNANIAVQGSNNVIEQRINQLANNITNVGYQPKQIPEGAVAEFVDTMRSLPPLKVHVTANILDPKTNFLADQLVELLRTAGWEVSGNSSSMYPDLPKGLVFIAPELTLSLDILTKFLKNVGFTNYARLDQTEMVTEPTGPLTIVVNGVD